VSAPGLPQRLLAEGLGSALLLATVVGSGVMAERLAGANDAIALLGNTLPTGAILVVLITMLAPISGAHLNPAVTFAFCLRREIPPAEAVSYAAAQLLGVIVGVVVAHLMFELPLVELSLKARSGAAQAFSEGVAAFGLVLTILLTRKVKPQAVPMSVGLYIVAAYWFTASTSFANPAVTVARSLTNTFSGIRPDDVIGFIAAQLVGTICALGAVSLLSRSRQSRPGQNVTTGVLAKQP